MKRSPLRRKSPMKSTTKRRIEGSFGGMPAARQAAESRARGRCEAQTPVCTGRGSQAHHRLRRSQGGSDTPDNLLWVCDSCHLQIHSFPAISFENGWLKHREAQ